MRLRLHAGLRARGRRGPKNLRHDGQASNPHGRTSHARTCKQNLSCLATVVRAGKLETVPALPSTTRRHPQLIPVTSEGVGWGCLLSGSSGNAGPVSYVMARQGGVLLPLTPPPEEGKAEGIRSCPRCSSSCVLKCSLDKSRPASPARLRLRLHAGLRARGRRGPKNLRHTTGKHRTRTDAQATPEPASRTCHVLRLLSVLESSKPCPHCRQRPGDTPANPRNK